MAPDQQDGPQTIAHRCFAGRYPENTVLAARRACAGEDHPAPDMVEIDVQPTADGDVVVFHDPVLDDLTDAHGRVWQQDTATVTGASVLGTGETIPLLDQVLAAVPDHTGVNIELKDIDSREVSFIWDEDDPPLGVSLERGERQQRRETWQPFVADVMDIADQNDNDVLVSSFFEGAIAATRSVAPDTPVAFLLYRSIEDGLAVTERYDCEAIHPPLDMVAGTPFFNDQHLTDQHYQDIDVAERAHSAGRAVNAWTARTWYEARQLREAGIDGIIADHPGLLEGGSSW